MKAIQIQQHGGPEVMQVVDVEAREPDSNEVSIHIAAAGVNFIEIYQRSGLYEVPLPFILGQEAAGIVETVGMNVKDFKPGDRVAYASVPGGSYATSNVVPASRVVRVPQEIGLKHAAAVMLQGMTAHYLARTIYPLKEGDTCLVHAAAGGVGLLLCQIARMQGATVIGTTSTEKKAELARSAGAEHIIFYTREDVPERVREITEGRGVDVVYDSVGKDTFDASLSSLRIRGMMVSFGQSSGAVPPFEPLMLSKKGSLFLTRPTLAHYTSERDELERRAEDIFKLMIDGKLKVRIDSEYVLERAAEAHAALESRKTSGKVLLVP
ncbi:MAG TPA: quinone oxidoreductase [Longimicrobiales bacterium]|nr:quinone oxidoreductase [Longimicrobiales bacterium]